METFVNRQRCLTDCVIVWCVKMKYTEEYEQSKAKGSFPAMITPGYQAAKQANSLASNVRHLSDVTESFRK